MKRNLYFCLLLLVFPLCLQAQLLRRTGEMTRFSLEVEGGVVSSFAMLKYFCIDCCGFDCFGTPSAYYQPVQTSYFSMKTMVQVGERHQLGFGGVISQKGFSRVNIVNTDEYYFYNEIKDYLGISITHDYTLLNAQRFNLGIGNEVQVDFYLGSVDYSNLYKHGLSHQASLILGFQASKHLELKLKGVGRTALSKYGDNAFDGPFHRFGTGLLLGMEYRLGKFKYHSPEKQ